MKTIKRYIDVKNYLSNNFSPVNAHYGKQREGKLEPFRSEVLQMRLEGITYREIYAHIKEKGEYFAAAEPPYRAALSHCHA